MADNVTLNAAVGTFTSAADDLGGGVLLQRVKVTFGPDGSASDVASGNPLPVSVIGTAPVSLASLPALATGGNVIGSISNTAFGITGSVAVTGTFFQATQPISGTVTANAGTGTFEVSAASLPLPTGASTETTLAALNTKTPVVGQAAMAASSPVVIASNQSDVPTAINDVVATGNITTQNLVPAGVATAGSAVEVTNAGRGAVTIQVTGTYTGALSAQATVNGTNWITISINTFTNVSTGTIATTIASAAVGIFQAQSSGYIKFRITGLAAMTGTAVVTIRASNAIASLNKIDAIGTITTITNGVNPAPSSFQGGFSSFTPVIAAASTNSTLIKGASGTIGNIIAHNNSATVKYIKVFNKATAPTVGTDTPVLNIALPANSLQVIPQASGMRFATGIGIAITGGQASLDATAVIAGDVVLNMVYA